MLKEHQLVQVAIVVPNEQNTSLIAFIELTDFAHLADQESVMVHNGVYFYASSTLNKPLSSPQCSCSRSHSSFQFLFCMFLPRLSSGKVSMLQLPSSFKIQKVFSTKYKDVQPLNAIEKQIHQIFRNVLCLDHVPYVENFFSLGGNSLLAIKVTAQIEEYFYCQSRSEIISCLHTNPF